MSICIIAILLENCPACEDFKTKYWNNIDGNWQEIAKNNYGFRTSTIIVPRDPAKRQQYQNYFDKWGINYIRSFPFIFAVKNDNYNVENVIVYCADYQKSEKAFIYRQTPGGSCRNLDSYMKYLDNVSMFFSYN